jgi:hypothetical protein
MFSKYLLILVVCLGLFNSTSTNAAVYHSASQTLSKSKKSKAKSATAKKGKKSKSKKGKKSKATTHIVKDSAQLKQESDNKIASLQMINDNQVKARVADSIRKTSLLTENKNKEGYYASMFSSQSKSAAIQTLEGTASVFKSLSGWDDGKFYILTNQMPIGTIVRITTPELKSICAKVLNSLPDVGGAVQYRLSDAAATILGISNKIFKVSVTY